MDNGSKMMFSVVLEALFITNYGGRKGMTEELHEGLNLVVFSQGESKEKYPFSCG